MKKLVFFFLAVVFTASSSLLTAQQQKRTSQIGSEKHRAIIKNFTPSGGQSDNNVGQRNGVGTIGTLIFSENFDGNGANLPPGWSVNGNSPTCMWAVDATPTPPGFYTTPFSLNYNNGVDFDCGWNWGWATSPLIDVSGGSFDISFMFYYDGENLYPDYDLTYLFVYDEAYDVIFQQFIDPAALNQWHQQTISVPNFGNHQKVYLEFYFDTGDAIINQFKGPFIDNLEVYSTVKPVPVSNWAIILGVLFIGAFIAVRYRRRLA